MNKTDMIDMFEKMKKKYKNKMFEIQNSIDTVFDNSKPILLDKGKFLLGEYLFKENGQIKNLIGGMFYDKLESFHSLWCEDYNKIINLYLKNMKTSFFSDNKIDDLSKDKAKAYYDDLEKNTLETMHVFDEISHRLHALPESNFAIQAKKD